MARTPALSPGGEGAGLPLRPDGPQSLEAPGWAWRWPELSWTSTRGFMVAVRAGFLLLLGLIMGVGWLVAWASATLLGTETTSAAALAFTALLLLGLLGHELGHVLAYRLAGAAWTGITFRGRGATVHRSAVFTPGRQLLVSIAGPAVEITIGAATMTLTLPWTATWIAGILVLANGILNAVLPMSRNSDATKIWRSLARLAWAALAPRRPDRDS